MNSSDEEDPQSSDVHVTPTEQIIVGVDVGLTYTGMWSEVGCERANFPKLVRASWKQDAPSHNPS